MSVNSLTNSSSETTENGTAFYPPIQWPLLCRLLQSISYPLVWQKYKLRLSVSDESVGRVRKVDESRLVFVCNHPTQEDGAAMLLLSARLGQLFQCLSSYSVFKGRMGWFLQRIGCYSVRKGVVDRASISQTITLLKQPRCSLLIFPEGGFSYQNGTVMPFRSGAFQLPLSVLSQFARKAESLEEVPDLYIVPISLRYRYRSSVENWIDTSLSRIEAKLKLSVDLDMSHYQRLRQIAYSVLINIESRAVSRRLMDRVEIPEPDTLTSDWNDRINHLRKIFIDNCENVLGIEQDRKLSLRERVNRVQASLLKVSTRQSCTKDGHSSALSFLSEVLLSSDRDSDRDIDVKEIYEDTLRLLNFEAIYDGYVAESQTAERFIETILRLEREVFPLEAERAQPPRRACFYIDEPVNLKSYLSRFKHDRLGTADSLSEELRQTIQANIDRI